MKKVFVDWFINWHNKVPVAQGGRGALVNFESHYKFFHFLFLLLLVSIVSAFFYFPSICRRYTLFYFLIL